MSRLGKMDTKRGRGCFLGSDNLGWSSSFIAFFFVGFMIYSIWIIIFFWGVCGIPYFQTNSICVINLVHWELLFAGEDFFWWLGRGIEDISWYIQHRLVNLSQSALQLATWRHEHWAIGSLFDDLGHMFIHVYPFFGSCADEGSMASVEQGFGFRASWWSRYQA